LTDWWIEALEKFDGSHLLVVAHSGSLRMLIALLRDKPIAYTPIARLLPIPGSRIMPDHASLRARMPVMLSSTRLVREDRDDR